MLYLRQFAASSLLDLFPQINIQSSQTKNVYVTISKHLLNPMLFKSRIYKTVISKEHKRCIIHLQMPSPYKKSQFTSQHVGLHTLQ